MGEKLILVWAMESRKIIIWGSGVFFCEIIKAIQWHHICFTLWLLNEEKKTAGAFNLASPMWF